MRHIDTSNLLSNNKEAYKLNDICVDHKTETILNDCINQYILEFKSVPESIKRKAREYVRDHIKSGKLQRQPCQAVLDDYTQCGCPETQAHHISYKKGKWLDVIWVCAKHHGRSYIKTRKFALLLAIKYLNLKL